MQNVVRRFGSRRGLIVLLCLMMLTPIAASGQTTTADFEVIFVATWSAQTHPVNFPPNPHFSPLIGGTHDAGVSFWAPGTLASNGIESMAETGNAGPLASEIDAEIGNGFADQVISGGGTNSPGSVSVSFTADQNYPMLTLVTMLAPSPDWFVGVHDVPLFEQGWWVPERVVDLYTYDAGTDLGTDYVSPNADASPALPTALQGFPLEVGVPVGTMTIRRLPEPGFVMQIGVALSLLAWLVRRRA